MASVGVNIKQAYNSVEKLADALNADDEDEDEEV